MSENDEALGVRKISEQAFPTMGADDDGPRILKLVDHCRLPFGQHKQPS
jgi:hypothetical protein